MTSFTWLHWMALVSILSLSLVALFFSFKLKGQNRFVAIFLLLLISTATLFITVISIDKATKKAVLTHLKNERVLRTEEMSFSGYITNTGDFLIGNSELEIKLINHGKASGRISGTTFYKTNSIFGDLFTNKKDQRKERPNTLKFKFVIAKELKPKERRYFTVRFKFPPYFKDVDYRLMLQNDLKEENVRIQ